MAGLVPAHGATTPPGKAKRAGRARAEFRTEDFLPFLSRAERISPAPGWQRAGEAAALMAYAAPFALAFPILAAPPFWVFLLMAGPNGAWTPLLETGWCPKGS